MMTVQAARDERLEENQILRKRKKKVMYVLTGIKKALCGND